MELFEHLLGAVYSSPSSKGRQNGHSTIKNARPVEQVLELRQTASEVAEEPGTDEQADTYPRVILVVVKHVLAISVIVLQHDELVGVMVDAVTQLHNGVEVQIPALALDQCHVKYPLVIQTLGLETGLINSHILEDVAVVLTVNDGNPILGMCHKEGRDVGFARQRNLIPAARGDTVTAVGFVLSHQRDFSQQAVFHDDIL